MWLGVQVNDFEYIPKNGKDISCFGFKLNKLNKLEDTEGCFLVTIHNRLPEQVFNLSIDHKIPPEAWLSTWRIKARVAEQPSTHNIPKLGKKTFILFRSIAVEPTSYYCRNETPLVLNILLTWKDKSRFDYSTLDKFRAECIIDKYNKTHFKWHRYTTEANK